MSTLAEKLAEAQTWADEHYISAVPILPRVRSRRDRALWLEERRYTVGGSDIAAVLGLPGAYTSAFALWWAKRSGWSSEQTESQEWGQRLEPAVAKKFAECHPKLKVVVPPASMWSRPGARWMTCTPDRLAIPRGLFGGSGPVQPVELKTDENPAAGRWADGPPAIYRAQLMWQCAVFGVRRGYLAALVRKRYYEYDLEFTDGEIADAMDAARDFHDSLLIGKAPDIDASPATTDALERVYAGYDPHATALIPADLAARYEVAKLTAEAATKQAAQAANEVRAAMGHAGKAMDPTGRVIARRLVFKRKGYSVAPTEIDELRYVPPKETS